MIRTIRRCYDNLNFTLVAKGLFVFAILAIWIYWFRLSKSQDIPYLIRDVRSITVTIKSHFRDEKESDLSWVMPDELPDSVISKHNSYTLSTEPHIQYLIDPFNQQKDHPKLTGKARTRDYSMRISGSRLSYIRIHDNASIVYSYGPDGDDDTSRDL